MGDPSVIVALIAAAVTVAQGVIGYFTLRGVRKADTTSKLTGSAVGLIEKLETRVEKLSARADKAEADNEALEKRIDELETAVKARDDRIKELEEENAGLRAEVTELREKLEHWEANYGAK